MNYKDLSMKKEEYKVPEIELFEAFEAEILCQSPSTVGGRTSDYDEDDDDIFSR